MIGEAIGHYRVKSKIGVGGMGEVYRAIDTKLNREVAIKILPDAVAHDPERLARFEREAKALAALNHPNIAQIYSIEGEALVMELIEGETLHGPLPVETALDYARQIVDALEAAHEKGIIHRDLKPANVMVTSAGVVKVLDFGLAAVAQAPTSDPVNSPTLTMSPTGTGVILGTAGYMSPEQAKGKKVDRRADIWAFGVVLYEMLSGRRAFVGETASEILAAVIMAEPDFEKLPPATPSATRKLLQRCLTKDPRRRLQAIGEARIAIEDVLSGSTPPEATALASEPSRLRRALPWILTALATAAFFVAGWAWLHPSAEAPRPVVRFTMSLPDAPNITGFRLSRDGSKLAYRSGSRQIYVRSMDQLQSRPLAGTEGAGQFFFSPDGRWIGFLLSGKLLKISVSGGASVPITDLEGGPFRIEWLPDDTIVFSKDGALARIPASGGKPEVIVAPEPNEETFAYSPQQALPDGRNLLVTVWRGPDDYPLSNVDLRSGRKKVLLDAANWAAYAPADNGKGNIIYRRGESLFAIAFDPARLQTAGSPVPLVEGVKRWQGTTLVDLSDSGVLAYVPGTADPEAQSALLWVDRRGVAQPLPAPLHDYRRLQVSPDGGRVAVQLGRPGSGSQIAVYDLARGTLTQLTFNGNNVTPIWKPDGKRLAYRSNALGRDGVFTMPADSSGPPALLTRENKLGVAYSWSPDGKLLIGIENGGRALWLFPIPASGSGGQKQSLLVSQFQKSDPMISPDGHWLAYASDETGRNQVYVQAFPTMGERWTISAEGGESPRWSRDGRELFYRNGNKLMAVDTQTSPAFHAAVPRMLFEGRYGIGYDVSPDSKRFLMIKPGPETPPERTELHVVVNWFEELRRLAPVVR